MIASDGEVWAAAAVAAFAAVSSIGATVVTFLHKSASSHQQHDKISAIEFYLKSEKEKKRDRGQRSAENIARALRSSPREVEDLTKKSPHVGIVAHTGSDGFVDRLLYEYKD